MLLFKKKRDYLFALHGMIMDIKIIKTFQDGKILETQVDLIIE